MEFMIENDPVHTVVVSVALLLTINFETLRNNCGCEIVLNNVLLYSREISDKLYANARI